MFNIEGIYHSNVPVETVARNLQKPKPYASRETYFEEFKKFAKQEGIPKSVSKTRKYRVLTSIMAASGILFGLGGVAIFPSILVCMGIKALGIKMLIISMGLVGGSFGLMFASLCPLAISAFMFDDYMKGDPSEKELIEILNNIRKHKRISAPNSTFNASARRDLHDLHGAL